MSAVRLGKRGGGDQKDFVKKKLWSKKILVKKNFGQKTFLVKTFLWVKKMIKKKLLVKFVLAKIGLTLGDGVRINLRGGGVGLNRVLKNLLVKIFFCQNRIYFKNFGRGGKKNRVGLTQGRR